VTTTGRFTLQFELRYPVYNERKLTIFSHVNEGKCSLFGNDKSKVDQIYRNFAIKFEKAHILRTITSSFVKKKKKTSLECIFQKFN
jgi:hypothetical protein